MSLISGPGRGGSTALPSDLTLLVDKHVAYIQSLDSRKDELAYWLTEHLRLNGLYWGLTALHLLKHPYALPRQDVLDFVFSCWHDNGGFGAAPGHDPHMLYTVSAIQILATLDALDELDRRRPAAVSISLTPPTTTATHSTPSTDSININNPSTTTDHPAIAPSISTSTFTSTSTPPNPTQNPTTGRLLVAHYLTNLQDPRSGTFFGDEFGESDTRFLFCALLGLSLLGQLHLLDSTRRTRTIAHLAACANPDGGFGTSPGAESHAGQIYTVVGALQILGSDATAKVLPDGGRALASWLSERQVPAGGLNGRPEKLEDVCYSWWVLSSLAMLGKLHYIDAAALKAFVLRCQDQEGGGIADRPGDEVDVFHTHFGIAGLALVDAEGLGLEPVSPIYCMPQTIVDRVLSQYSTQSGTMHES